MRRVIESSGLGCGRGRVRFRELKERLDDRIRFARALGLKQMILSTFGLAQDAPLAAWTQAAMEWNAIRRKVPAAGMRLGFHNHDFEFRGLERRTFATISWRGT
jgi:sugar phosphate isomerase/epimerase